MTLRLSSHILLISLAALTLSCAGCASKKGEDAAAAIESHAPVGEMYNEAAGKLDADKYTEAATSFDAVEQNYPYSQWAARAQLMAAYSSYRNLKYDEALDALNRFIELHPSDDNVAYAYYLRAVCYYEQITDVRRDQEMTERALDALKQVKTRFPDTKYARDASLKIDLTYDHLAGKEMEIGRYYLGRKQYQAAINRFNRVVEQYQMSAAVPEALHRLTEAYLSLGIRQEALKTAAILGQNYPDSRWYKDTYKFAGLIAGEKAEAKDPTLYDKTLGRVFN